MLPPDTFNSGVMVVTPSASTFKRLQEAAGHIESYDGSDQGFLNRSFLLDSMHIPLRSLSPKPDRPPSERRLIVLLSWLGMHCHPPVHKRSWGDTSLKKKT